PPTSTLFPYTTLFRSGHDDDRVLEIDHAPLAVGQPAVIEDLQHHVEDIVMGLLDLVKQDDAVRLAAHGLGQLAALFVADVAGRRDRKSTRLNSSHSQI